jgi:hypothetical protein
MLGSATAGIASTASPSPEAMPRRPPNVTNRPQTMRTRSLPGRGTATTGEHSGLRVANGLLEDWGDP